MARLIFVSWKCRSSPDYFAIRYQTQTGQGVISRETGDKRLHEFQANLGDKIHFEIFAVKNTVNSAIASMDFEVVDSLVDTDTNYGKSQPSSIIGWAAVPQEDLTGLFVYVSGFMPDAPYNSWFQNVFTLDPGATMWDAENQSGLATTDGVKIHAEVYAQYDDPDIYPNQNTRYKTLGSLDYYFGKPKDPPYDLQVAVYSSDLHALMAGMSDTSAPVIDGLTMQINSMDLNGTKILNYDPDSRIWQAIIDTGTINITNDDGDNEYLTPAPATVTIVANLQEENIKFLSFSISANYLVENPGNAPEAPFFNIFTGFGTINSNIGNASEELVKCPGATLKFTNK